MTLEERIQRTARRLQWAGVVFLLATLLLIAGVAYSVWGVQAVTERVTVIEQSPCRVDPHGRECRLVVADLVRALPASATCQILQQGLRPAAYRRLTRCH